MASTASTTNAAPTTSHGPLTGSDEAAPHAHAADTSMRCPDPSAHQTKSSVLQNQASAAALYSTNRAHNANSNTNPLGPDGKLSSASAATSLKYARAQDLPSFPVVGIDTKSSAGAAALLANQNKKSPEWWKPEQSTAAGKAALLANDYKMAPLWQPEASAAGSKAAMLAHRDGVKLNLWTPEPSADGNSAANIAFRKKGLGPEIDYGYTDQGRKNAFVAATGAHSTSGRKRAQSIPASVPLYPDSKNSAKNALSAATIAHSPSTKAKPQTATGTDSIRMSSGAMEAARIQHAKSISRDMYTSAPPVALEVDEKRHNDALRASAISMAKKIYSVQQQQQSDGTAGQSAARTGANAAHGQQPASGEGDIKQQAMRYIGIQEAAQKLAQERLAKIGYDENAAYRSYYGYDQPARSKLSMRRGRNRAHSASGPAPANDSDSDEDDFRSRRIRSQMEQFNQQLADVDAKKRDTDRKSLLAAAQRKVQAQMQGMDKKIFDETGKMSPAMVDDWDEKAKKRALANSEARMENYGRVHLGNGKWMDQSEIDAIAQARIQPTLDEITEKTEKRLAEDERRRAAEQERRLDMEEKKRHERVEKERAAELKAEEKQLRDEEKRTAKARAAGEKTAAKQEKEAEKTRKAGDDRLAKDEKRKSREAPTAVPAIGSEVASPRDNDELYKDPTPTPHETDHDTADPTSPTSQGSSKGLKSLINKLKRRSKPATGTELDEKTKEKDSGFIGGAALRSSPSDPQAHRDLTEPPADLGDVEPRPAYVPHVDPNPHSEVSSLSNYDDDDNNTAPRGRLAERVVSSGTVKSGGTDFEEARDHFDADLAPPPTFTSDADKARKGSPNRDSKFHEVGL